MAVNKDKTLLSYLAGFFDGEGCIGIYPRTQKKTSYRLSVSVSNTNEWVMRLFHFNFGGSLNQYHYSPRQPIWKWDITETGALLFLKSICNYLVVKRAEAEIGIKFLEQRVGRGHHLTKEAFALQEAQAILTKNLKRRDSDER